jgi:hypothetical protein
MSRSSFFGSAGLELTIPVLLEHPSATQACLIFPWWSRPAYLEESFARIGNGTAYAMINGRTTILTCLSCRQRLRVPVDRGALVLTCPVCRSRWDWSPPPVDVRFIDDEVLFIGDDSPPGEPEPPGGGDWSSGDLWDDWLDGPQPRERPGTVILPCPSCRRLLRVPMNRGELILTCPICRNRWEWFPSPPHEPPLERSWVRWACQVLLQRRG